MKFMFDSIEDTVALAKEIQTFVYWGYRFYYGEDEESQSYIYFWNLVASVLSEGYKGVMISESHEVSFIR